MYKEEIRHTIFWLGWVLTLFLPLLGVAQHHHGHHHAHKVAASSEELSFIANKGQFHDNVEFEVALGGLNRLFIEESTFTYAFFKEESMDELHELYHNKREDIKNLKIPGHVYKMHIKNALKPSISGQEKIEQYRNYFIGKDKSKWASKVPIYKRTIHRDIYKNIDLACYSSESNFKYDFIVKKGGDAKDITLEYESLDDIYIKENHLFLVTSVGTTRESAPYAYQIINGKMVLVHCEYHLEDKQVSFVFPNGYDTNYNLVIDPEVIAATLSGTVGSENFGHTATYDVEGNIYAGGVSFGVGYPTHEGAFDDTFAVGFGNRLTDMVFSKYSTDGSQLLYATYVGGGRYDYPHSMIVDVNNQLCVLGTTDSGDFPTLDKSYQKERKGSMDIVVLKLNSDASDLVGVTYLGGAGSDGINLADKEKTHLSYGEDYRGEIVLDAQGNMYIASVSSSDDFPITVNTLQQSRGGGQDGIVAKLNSDLSTLFWSTYIGSKRDDTASGIKVDDNGNIIVIGTAGSRDFPMTKGGIHPTWIGGNECAFLSILSPDGQEMIKGTYWGTTNGNDHGYFVDIDEEKNIHILGTTTGTGLPLTPNTYSFNHGSPQFLAAFTPNLDEIVYSTTIGRGKFQPNQKDDGSKYDFVPIAFMVDKCNSIYFSGYFAEAGLPVSNGAFANSEETFYLGVLEPNASALSFGTYYGDANHVDGGTSRFDKAGIVYQGVCSCKDDARVLNTVANAWADKQAERCDVGVFKIDFQKETVTAAISASPGTSGCIPYTVDLSYAGHEGIDFEWHIENRVISATAGASYTFYESGHYNVMLIAKNRNTCNRVDTAYMQIDVLDQNSTLRTINHCSTKEQLFLDASTSNATYLWNDGHKGATYAVKTSGTYWVDVNLDGCTHRDSFLVTVADPISFSLGNDTTACDVKFHNIDATHPNAATYIWNTGSTNSLLKVSNDGTYNVTITDVNGCVVQDDIQVRFRESPIFDFEDRLICEGESVDLVVPKKGDYTWSNGAGKTDVSFTESGKYWLRINNDGCLHTDTFQISVSPNPIYLEIDSMSCYGICDGKVVINFHPDINTKNIHLDWNVANGGLVLANLCEGIYQVTATDSQNCQFVHKANVTEPEPLLLETEQIPVRCHGENNGVIYVSNIEGGTSPYTYFLNEENRANQDTFRNLAPGIYTVEVEDKRGCKFTNKGITLVAPYFNLVEAEDDKYIELGDSVQLDGYVLSPTNQVIFWREEVGLWCNDCLEPYVTPYFTTTYELVTRDTTTGCELTDQARVVVNKDRNVFIPNVFTPNDDGKNDHFTVFGRSDIEKINFLRIYDRWGELVYKGEDFQPNIPKLGWNGYFRGQLMNPAVFVYYTEILFVDGHVERYKGDVTLVQ